MFEDLAGGLGAGEGVAAFVRVVDEVGDPRAEVFDSVAAADHDGPYA